MSAKVKYKLEIGKDGEELYPTKDEAISALNQTLEQYKSKGCEIKNVENGSEVLYSVYENSILIGTYQIVQ